MVEANDGNSRYDMQASISLSEALINDQAEVRRMQREMGTEIMGLISTRVNQLVSLGIFPQQQVVRFDQSREAVVSTQRLIVLKHDAIEGSFVLPHGYESAGISTVVDSDGRITKRNYLEKDGEVFPFILGVSVSPEELYAIGKEALGAIEQVNTDAMQRRILRATG